MVILYKHMWCLDPTVLQMGNQKSVIALKGELQEQVQILRQLLFGTRYKLEFLALGCCLVQV